MNVLSRIHLGLRGRTLLAIGLSSLGGVCPDLPHLWGARHFPAQIGFVFFVGFFVSLCVALYLGYRAMGMVKE